MKMRHKRFMWYDLWCVYELWAAVFFFPFCHPYKRIDRSDCQNVHRIRQFHSNDRLNTYDMCLCIASRIKCIKSHTHDQCVVNIKQINIMTTIIMPMSIFFLLFFFRLNFFVSIKYNKFIFCCCHIECAVASINSFIIYTQSSSIHTWKM